MGDKDVGDALTRLEKLTTKEALTTAAEIHVIVKETAKDVNHIIDIHSGLVVLTHFLILIQRLKWMTR